jgi:hypothetical protein
MIAKYPDRVIFSYPNGSEFWYFIIEKSPHYSKETAPITMRRDLPGFTHYIFVYLKTTNNVKNLS